MYYAVLSFTKLQFDKGLDHTIFLPFARFVILARELAEKKGKQGEKTILTHLY